MLQLRTYLIILSFSCASLLSMQQDFNVHEHFQERLRRETLQDSEQDVSQSYYRIAWPLGNPQQFEPYLEELNSKLRENSLEAVIGERKENAIVLNINAELVHDESPPGSKVHTVHTIEMPLDNNYHPKRLTDFLMRVRTAQIEARGKELRECLNTLTSRELRKSWKVIVNLQILPSVTHQIATLYGNNFGKFLVAVAHHFQKQISLHKSEYKVAPLKKKSQHFQALEDFTETYEHAVQELENQINNATDPTIINALKTQKINLDKEYCKSFSKYF